MVRRRPKAWSKGCLKGKQALKGKVRPTEALRRYDRGRKGEALEGLGHAMLRESLRGNC